MRYIIKLPLMDIVNEEAYTGDSSTVVEADTELTGLISNFFLLSSNYRNWTSGSLTKLVPACIRNKKIANIKAELDTCIDRINKKGYNLSKNV